MPPAGHYAVQESRLFEVTNFDVIRKLVCNFLLVNVLTHTLYCTICKLLWIIGKIVAFHEGYLSLTHLSKVNL